jgi:hypothetical protein
MIGSMEVDMRCVDPKKAVKYTGEIEDWEPFDERWNSVMLGKLIGIKHDWKVEEVDGLRQNVGDTLYITDEPDKEGFMYIDLNKKPEEIGLNGFQIMMLQQSIQVAYGKNLNTHEAAFRLLKLAEEHFGTQQEENHDKCEDNQQ